MSRTKPAKFCLWAVMDTGYLPRPVPVAAFVNPDNAKDDAAERNQLGVSPERYTVLKVEYPGAQP